MEVRIDAACACEKKYGQEFGGEQAKVIRGEDGVTAILVDAGTGGAAASMLSAFAVSMTAAMAGAGKSPDEIADVLLESQQDGGGFAFTLIRAFGDGTVSAAQFGTPEVILFRRGKPVRFTPGRREHRGRTVFCWTADASQADTIVAVDSGMLNAAAGRDLKQGWNRGTIAVYLENAYCPRITAEKTVQLLLAAGVSLSRGKPENDLSALVFRMTRQGGARGETKI